MTTPAPSPKSTAPPPPPPAPAPNGAEAPNGSKPPPGGPPKPPPPGGAKVACALFGSSGSTGSWTTRPSIIMLMSYPSMMYSTKSIKCNSSTKLTPITVSRVSSMEDSWRSTSCVSSTTGTTSLGGLMPSGLAPSGSFFLASMPSRSS